MKSVTLSLATLAALIPAALAVGEWSQCGGIGYTGSTTCDSGLTCLKQNDYYWQCQRTSTTATSSTTKTTTTSSNTSSTTSSTTAVTGFVKVSGQKFTVNGATYNVVGTNAYWLAQLSSTSLITQAFSEIAQAGTTVVRTWGFNDVTSVQSYGAYYQLWSNGTPTINTGSNGLGKFDTVVAQAKAAGIRLIVPLVNNWGDYGGMDVYVSQILGSGQAHSNFYTNANVKTAFKNYVKTFVQRYANEPTIMAWELANEPRCHGCAASVITSWATEMSAYIKTLDTNHLVALGDEGFLNNAGTTVAYQLLEGIDFAANLAISSLDFGTFHSYPITWEVTTGYQAWGSQWITDHITLQKSKNKPVLLEEYGVATSDRSTVYAAWWSAIETGGLSGDLYWQAGTSASGSGYNDGYAIFPTDSIFAALKTHEAYMKART